MSQIDDFAASVVAYLDGGADAQAVRRLEALLRAQPARRAEFVALATMQGLLEEVTLARPDHAATPPHAARPTLRIQPWRQPRSWILAAALAALVVLALTWWSLTSRASAAVAEIVALQGTVSVVRTGASTALLVGARLRAGDALTTATQSSCAVSFVDHSRVVIAAQAQVVLPQMPDQGTIVLTQGELTAEVAPQAAGRHFQVRTPRGLVTVVGTAFSVAVDVQGTRVAVSHGTVSLQDLLGRVVAVHAGERAAIAADQGWVARLETPDCPPAPLPPAPALPSLPAAVTVSALHPFQASSWWNRPCPLDVALSAPAGALAVPWGMLEIGTAQVRQLVAGSSLLPLRRVVRRGGTAVLGSVRVPGELRLLRGVSQGGFLIVIDEQSRTIWEGARPEIKRDGSIAVTAISQLPLDGDGLPSLVDGARQPAPPEGALASGLPACAGLLRQDELEQGITHVLAMTLPARCINASVGGDAHWVAPARGPRVPPPTCGHSGNLHIGSRLVLPSGTAAQLPAGAVRVLALALERYGACVVGFSDRPQLCADATASAQAAPLTAAVAALCAQLRVADPR